MSVIGEAILCELIAKVIWKSISIARHIASNSRNFVSDRENFRIRLNVQITRLDEVRRVLNNQLISDSIQPRDRHTYVHVMQKLHRLLLDYVIATEGTIEGARQFVMENAANEEFEQIQMGDPALATPSRAQEKFWFNRKSFCIVDIIVRPCSTWANGATRKAMQLYISSS